MENVQEIENVQETENVREVEKKPKDKGISFFPLLYVLLVVDGILTALLIAGIVWFVLHPVESAGVQTDAQTAIVEEQQPPSYGPRTMISTYSIRAEERGWEQTPEAVVGNR